MQATQSPVVIGDWGYQIYGSAGNPYQQFGLAQYKSPSRYGSAQTGAMSPTLSVARNAASFSLTPAELRGPIGIVTLNSAPLPPPSAKS